MSRILVTLLMAQLVGATAALAQSQQGGYLGKNPGADSPAAATTALPAPTSGQGGYLGENPAAANTTSGSAQPVKGSGEGGYLGMPNVAAPASPK